MNYHDFYPEMLNLYIEQKNIPKWKKAQLLEDNPFNNTDFIRWLKQTEINNIELAHSLIRKHLINKCVPIQEITVHENNSTGQYLSRFLNEDISYVQCSINYDITKLRLPKKLVLVKEFYPKEKEFLKSLQFKNIPFIVGICSKQRGYYLHILNEYQKILKDLKNCELINDQNNEHYISIIKTK